VNARPHLIPAAAAALLLFAAVGQHPYGYYTFLRWTVCIAAIFVAWISWHSQAQWATWLFTGVAALFNPVAPVYLHRSTWRPIDIVCGLVFVGSTAIERRASTSSP
jgi:hypothetical protein